MEVVFLGSSQTLLGTLSTLTLLCVFINDGNFILQVLKGISKRIDFQIKAMSKVINQEVNGYSIRSNPNFIRLVEFISKGVDSNLYFEGNRLKRNIEKKIVSLQVYNLGFQYNKNFYYQAQKHKFQELFVAPFYSFLLTLILFFYDELITCGQVYHLQDMFVSSLAILILFSYVFWLAIWINFICVKIFHLGSKFIDNQTNNSEKDVFEFPFNSNFINSLIKKIFWGLFAFYVVLFICSFFPIPRVTARLFFIATIILPFFIIGLSKLNFFCKIHYTYITILGHIVLFTCISFFLSISIFCFIRYVPSFEFVLFEYDNLLLLKYLALFFVVLNGLVLPFLLPYLGLIHTLSMFQRRRRKYHNQIRLIEKDLADFNIKILKLKRKSKYQKKKLV